jgi:hypothetical protein
MYGVSQKIPKQSLKRRICLSLGLANQKRTLRSARLIALCLLCFLSLGAHVYAQTENSGQVLGTITDSQGQIIPGASLILVETERGSRLTVTSNSHGEYLFSSVSVGIYTLEASAPSFGKTTEGGIEVDAQQNVRLDLKLLPADVQASVVVNGVGDRVDTQSATLGLIIDKDMVHNLPIDGNNIVALAALLPGVSNVNAPTTFTSDTGGPTYNVNGARNTENLFLLDGAIWNNLYYNTGLNYPPPDSLQESSVQLNNFKAAYGRNTGSIFNVVTKSGTNTFHGTLYDYVQNRIFNAADYISKLNPKLVQNQFGGTIGGPILRDKLFFFVAYQDLRAAQTATANASTFTQAQRGVTATGAPIPCSSTGVFAGQDCAINLGTTTVAGNPTPELQNPLYGPATAPSTAAISALNAAYAVAGGTGTSPCVTELQAALAVNSRYITTGELPYVCINPVAEKLLQYVPLPNLTTGLAVSQAPSPKNDQNLLVRGDYQLAHHSIDARYYWTSVNDMLAKSTAYGTGVASYEIDRDTGGIEFGDIGDTWVIRSNLLNIFRADYKRYTYNIMPTDPTTLSTLGADFVTPTTVPTLPEILVNGDFALGAGGMGLTNSVNENVELLDTLSWSKGTNNFQFGADFLRLQYVYKADTVPYLEFGSQHTGSFAADYLMGLTETETVGNQLNRAGIQHVVYLYGQDDWRITSRLTLNLGLRYELPLPYFQPKNESETFIPGYQSILYPQAPPDLAFVGDPGVRRGMTPSEFDNVAPRFGFAYDVFGNGKTAIRGSAGLFYSATNALVIGVGEPFNYRATYAYPAGGLSEPLLGESVVPANYNGKTAEFTSPFSIFYTDKNFKSAYSEAFSVGIQQAIRSRGLLEINYVGHLGRHQLIPLDQNPAIYDCSGSYSQLNRLVYCDEASATQGSYQERMKYPNFNYGGQGVVDYMSIGTSNYNGAQVLYTQRAMRGISMITSFTYSKSMDEQSNGQTVSNSVPQPWNIKTQYARSDYDSKLNLSIGWRTAPTSFAFPHQLERTILNGWMTSGTYSARTGSPFSVTIPSDTALTDEPDQRASYTSTETDHGVLPSNRHRLQKVAEYFDTSAFITPPTKGTYSTLGRNTLTGPSYIVTNFGVGRVFPIHALAMEKLEGRVDSFNLFNTPNLANPVSQYSTSACMSDSSANGCNYGKILTTAGTNNAVGTNGRRLQVSLKLIF